VTTGTAQFNGTYTLLAPDGGVLQDLS